MVISFFYSRKKRATPAILKMTPIISFGLTGCLYMRANGAIIRTGVSAIKVEAIPVSVYWTAARDRDTPITGPKRVVSVAKATPLFSLKIPLKLERSLCRAIQQMNPAPPIIARIIVEANGSMGSISAVASGGIAAA